VTSGLSGQATTDLQYSGHHHNKPCSGNWQLKAELSPARQLTKSVTKHPLLTINESRNFLLVL
jgi:hypothetical protein